MQGACLIVDDNATLRDASKVLIAKYGNIDAYTLKYQMMGHIIVM